MNIYSLPDIFAFIFNTSFAVRLLTIKGEKKIKYWLLFVFLLFVLWNLSNLVTLNLPSREWALLGAQITYRILFLLPAFILSLSLEFIHAAKKYSLRFWFFIIFIIPVLLLALSFPDFNLRLIEFPIPENTYYFTLTSEAHPAFYGISLFAVIYIGLAIYFTQKEQKKMGSLHRRILLRKLIYGLIGVFLLFLFIHLFNNRLRSYSAIYFLKTSFLFLQVFFFYIILNSLVKEEEWAYSRKILSYLIFTGLLAVYFIIIKVSIELIDAFLHIHSFYFDAGLIVFLTLFFQPVEVLINKAIFQKIKNHLFTYRSNFLSLTNELVEMLPNEQLLDKIRQFIQTNFQIEEVFIFRLNEKTQTFECAGIPYELESDSGFISFLSTKTGVLELTEINRQAPPVELRDLFVEKDIQLLIPIQKEGRLFHFIALGAKRNRKNYSREELEVLSIFSNEISLSLHRNYLFEKIQLDELEKFRLEKLAALGQLTAGIAHEIRNPLNTISAAAQTLQNADTDEEIRKRMAAYIEEEVQRLNGLVNEFLELSRLKKPDLEDVELGVIMEKLSLFLKSKETRIQLEIRNEVKEPLVTDSKFLYQILTNLSLNAIEALEDRCKNEPAFCRDARLSIQAKRNKQYLTLTISNNGYLISPEIRERIFEPFFTTKETGTGLGLSLVENMVKSLGGTISLKSDKKRTQFIIKTPLSP